MKNVIRLLVMVSALSVTVFGQKDAGLSGKPLSEPSAEDYAKTAVTAHGGDKLKQIKSIVIKGSVDLNVSNQILPGAFSTAVSGDKYYFEITSAVQSLKQVFDGQQTYSSIPGFMLPPVTSVGFPVLWRIGTEGYVVSPYGDAKKKRKGFRVTSPDGFYTDFWIDEKTGQIKGFQSAYEVGGRVITTAAEIDEVITVEGVVIPKKYSQRFDLGGQANAYANFKAKDILVNVAVGDSAFAIPR